MANRQRNAAARAEELRRPDTERQFTATKQRAAAKRFVVSAYSAGILSAETTERLIAWGGLRHA